jgi:putative pyoverdin transport system ATP-binding/permease protein
MNFFRFLKDEVKIFTPKMVSAYTLSGLSHFLIIILIILSALEVPNPPVQNLLLFVVFIYGYIRIQQFSMNFTSNAIEQTLTELRLGIINKIRHMTLLSFEHFDKNQVITLLTQESIHIYETTNMIPRLSSAVILFVIAFLYVAYLSFPAFLISLCLIVVGIAYYRINRGQHEKFLNQAREHEDHFFNLLHHLLHGFKELKINDAKNNDFFYNHLIRAARQTEKLKIFSLTQLNKSVIFAHLFSYLLLAFLIFIFPYLSHTPAEKLTQIVTIILFLTTGPLQEIVGAFPFIERSNLAITHLRQINEKLEQSELDEPIDQAPSTPPTPFQELILSDVTFTYNNTSAETRFQIGPVNITVTKGDLIFLMGGNGAGKTTFLKVLTGLYPHQKGAITYNGQVITPKNRTEFQSNFSVIFQDMHLFDRLYGIESLDEAEAKRLLEQMHLSNKTSITPELEITNPQLSTGQQKRLALLIAELENKDIFIFDEWAAEQDPNFRRYFYEEYLPSLKARGKTVIAITHDDKYYSIADKIYRMEYGILSEITSW